MSSDSCHKTMLLKSVNIPLSHLGSHLDIKGKEKLNVLLEGQKMF